MDNLTNEKPAPVANPDLTKVISLCQNYLETIAGEDAGGRTREEFDTTLTEAVLRAVYGEKVFGYINECTEKNS